MTSDQKSTQAYSNVDIDAELASVMQQIEGRACE
jgi:hypothetical protein